jgi:Zn ribbon nucleic-acid-binding protein
MKGTTCPRCKKDELYVDPTNVHVVYCGNCGYIEGVDNPAVWA